LRSIENEKNPKKWIIQSRFIKKKSGNSLITWKLTTITLSKIFVSPKPVTGLFLKLNLTWMLKPRSRDTSVSIKTIPESIKPVKSLLRKHLMATKNMFEVLNTFEVPSMNFLIRKDVF
jgi:hypothetical protein